MNEMVFVEEVGLREGLQSVDRFLSLKDKIKFVEMVITSGIKRIQLGSFVNPAKIPQASDTDALFEYFTGYPDIIFTGLVLNGRGFERALKCSAKHLNISISASRTHQNINTGKDFDKSFTEICKLIREAKKENIKVRGGIQAVFGCHYEGKVSIKTIKNIVSEMIISGVDEIGLSDTSGFATPASVEIILNEINDIIGDKKIALHLHNTIGMGLANVIIGLEKGVTVFDSSIAGIGGCPFMIGAAGNLPTEDLCFMLKSLGYLENISIEKLVNTSEFSQRLFNKSFGGKISLIYKKMKELDIVDGLYR